MQLTDSVKRSLYECMLRIRLFEMAAKENEVDDHLCIGQEAANTGACMSLRSSDFLTGYHRSHGHAIAKGVPLNPLMAELMLKVDGICKGRGGTLHLADPDVGLLGTTAIVGGGKPLALGAGLSAQLRGTDQVSLCVFGDGASNQGTFHESLNMAALWKLPVIFFCDNNLYAISTSTEKSRAQPDVAKHAEGYGIPGVIVDGQDVEAVYIATSEAVERARRGDGPTLIEAKTYRFEEHCRGLTINIPYRSDSEVEHYKLNRDPISLYRNLLLADQVVSEDELLEIDNRVAAEITEAVTFGKGSTEPDIANIYDYMYGNPIHYPPANPIT